MDKEQFWQILEAAKTQAQGDQQRQEQALIESLTQLEPAQIAGFECRLREYLLEADHFNILAAQKIIDGYVSDDTYLYFRCWLVSQGEATFNATLANPDTLAAVLDAPYQEFEDLLSVATAAFRQRTGKTDDDTSPRKVALARGLDYDADAETKGDDWTENQLPKMLPKLWKKFGAA